MPAPRQQVATRRPVTTMFRPETLETIVITANNQEYSLSGNGGMLPRDRFLSGLLLTVKFRITNASSNNPSAALADAPYNIIDRVTVYGKHALRRTDETIVSLSGSELAELQRLNTRYAIQGSVPLVTTADATNDIRFVLHVPFVPWQVHPNAMANYLLDGPNYQTLYLKIKWADDKSIFRGQTSASTFSAFGSTTGNPTIDVVAFQAMEPSSKFNGFVPGLYSIYSRPVISQSLLTTGQRVRITDLPRGGRLRRIVLKTGVQATTVTSGNSAFNTLSDDVLTRINVKLGSNKIVWDARDFLTARANMTLLNPGSVTPSTGHLVVDWVRTGNDAELFNATGLIAGSTGDTDFFIEADVAGASNQNASLIVEEVVQQPTLARPA